jgi:hypothetical protein
METAVVEMSVKAQTPLVRFVVDLLWICCTTSCRACRKLWNCCGIVVDLLLGIQLKLDPLVRFILDLLWICCTTCCTTNSQQIEQVEFELKGLSRWIGFNMCWRWLVERINRPFLWTDQNSKLWLSLQLSDFVLYYYQIISMLISFGD